MKTCGTNEYVALGQLETTGKGEVPLDAASNTRMTFPLDAVCVGR